MLPPRVFEYLMCGVVIELHKGAKKRGNWQATKNPTRLNTTTTTTTTTVYVLCTRWPEEKKHTILIRTINSPLIISLHKFPFFLSFPESYPRINSPFVVPTSIFIPGTMILLLVPSWQSAFGTLAKVIDRMTS